MDKRVFSLPSQGHSRSVQHNQSRLPPSKPETALTASEDKDWTQQVDSWRSYRNDTSNLQSRHPQPAQSKLGFFTSTAPMLNPTAPSFMPNSNILPKPTAGSHFTPYQPLRISNGEHERQVVQHAKAQRAIDQSRVKSLKEEGHRASRSTKNTSILIDLTADDAVPSIERNDLNSSIPGRPINETLLRVTRTGSERYISRSPTPPPAPKSTKAYLAQAKLPPCRRNASTQRLLVILDLNGTLLYRKNRSQPTSFQPRPGVTPLLDYLFTNHVVMIYTSARPENALGMVNKLLHPKQRIQLAAIWARDKLDLTQAQYNGKVQVYKKLEKIWKDASIQKTAGEGRKWDQSNTVLVDDSHLKALAQPHNLLQVPEFINDKPTGSDQAIRKWFDQQQDILKGLEVKLEQLKWQVDVSRLIRLWQTGEAQISTLPGETVIVSESLDQREVRQDRGNFGQQRESLLTPRSPVEADEGATSTNDSHSDTTGGAPVRSESPIDESVWKELLAGERSTTGDGLDPRTPSSLER